MVPVVAEARAPGLPASQFLREFLRRQQEERDDRDFVQSKIEAAREDRQAGRLADFPRLGRPGMIAGTRELIVHESYRLIDDVDEPDEVVWGLARGHTARRWPALH